MASWAVSVSDDHRYATIDEHRWNRQCNGSSWQHVVMSRMNTIINDREQIRSSMHAAQRQTNPASRGYLGECKFINKQRVQTAQKFCACTSLTLRCSFKTVKRVHSKNPHSRTHSSGGRAWIYIFAPRPPHACMLLDAWTATNFLGSFVVKSAFAIIRQSIDAVSFVTKSRMHEPHDFSCRLTVAVARASTSCCRRKRLNDQRLEVTMNVAKLLRRQWEWSKYETTRRVLWRDVSPLNCHSHCQV